MKPKTKPTADVTQATKRMDQAYTQETDEINRAKMMGAMYELAQDLESMLQAAARRDREGIA